MSTITNLPSTQPYLLRALHEWCTDNGFTPHLVVKVDGSVQVPVEYVQNGEIVLNISYDASSNLQIGNEYVEFQARFGGTPRQIIVPIHRILAIYARENGQGMAFTVQDAVLTPAPKPTATRKPQLKSVSLGSPQSESPAEVPVSASEPKTEATDQKTAETEAAPKKRRTASKTTASKKSAAKTAAVKPLRKTLSKVAPEDPGVSTTEQPPEPPVPPTKPAAGKRPALKRIK